MVQVYGDSKGMIWELATDLLKSSSRRDVWQCWKAEVWKTGGQAPGMDQYSHCFGRVQGSCLNLWPGTSPSRAVKSLPLLFSNRIFRLKRNEHSFQMKQKLMISQQFQPSLAKFCSGTNESLPSGVYFQLSKLKLCPCDPFAETENFMGHF